MLRYNLKRVHYIKINVGIQDINTGLAFVIYWVILFNNDVVNSLIINSRSTLFCKQVRDFILIIESMKKSCIKYLFV